MEHGDIKGTLFRTTFKRSFFKKQHAVYDSNQFNNNNDENKFRKEKQI